MKRAIIIHGWGGNPQNEWFPWLSENLKENGWKVETPEMPNTKNPKFNEWMDTLLKLKPDENTVLIGHSLANAVILHYLEKANVKIKGAIMVAAWDWLLENVKSFHETFFTNEFNYAEIKKKDLPLFIVNSTNDPWLDFPKTKLLAPKIGAKFITVEKAGHFMARDGFSTFPLLLELIKKEF